MYDKVMSTRKNSHFAHVETCFAHVEIPKVEMFRIMKEGGKERERREAGRPPIIQLRTSKLS